MKKNIIAGIIIFSFSTLVFAEERIPPVTDQVTINECGACHMVYPAKLLGAKSWEKLISGLDNHFGEDASLEKSAETHIKNYLMINAGRHSETPLRITNLRWFKREHTNRGNWKKYLIRKNINSSSNCIACHKAAEKGVFDD